MFQQRNFYTFGKRKRQLKNEEFKTQYEKNNFKAKDKQITASTPIDTSLVKLQEKYANLKSRWPRITDRVKSWSNLAPAKEPRWSPHLNEIFTETNKELDLAAESGYLSYIEDIQDTDDEKHSSLTDANFPSNEEGYDGYDDSALNNEANGQPNSKWIKKILATPCKKWKTIRSQQQALSWLADKIEKMRSSQIKRNCDNN